MQDAPLLIRDILRHGQRVHGDSAVITVEEGGQPPGHLHRGGDPGGEAGRRPDPPGHRGGRPRRHLLLEQPGPPRGLSRHSRHGRRAAHAQHPPPGRPAGLRRQPRRGPLHHRRRLAHPVAGRHQGRPEDRRDHHRGGGGGHLVPRRDALLRAAARRRGAGLRLARARRALRRSHVLHERDDRQPQGRRVLAPLHLAAHHGRAGGLLGRHDRAGPHPHHRAHVPRHRLGHPLRRLAGRHRHDHAADVPHGAATWPPSSTSTTRRWPAACRPSGTACSRSTRRSTSRPCAASRPAAPPCRSRSSRPSRTASASPSSRAGA